LPGGNSSAQRFDIRPKTLFSDPLVIGMGFHCFKSSDGSPKASARIGLLPGGRILVRSRRAELVAEACITPMVQPGQVFIPMHYREVNPLIKSVVDPLSRQPSYKFCAVTLEALPPS
jgi:hypothetical protein